MNRRWAAAVILILWNAALAGLASAEIGHLGGKAGSWPFLPAAFISGVLLGRAVAIYAMCHE